MMYLSMLDAYSAGVLIVPAAMSVVALCNLLPGVSDFSESTFIFVMVGCSSYIFGIPYWFGLTELARWITKNTKIARKCKSALKLRVAVASAVFFLVSAIVDVLLPQFEWKLYVFAFLVSLYYSKCVGKQKLKRRSLLRALVTNSVARALFCYNTKVLVTELKTGKIFQEGGNPFQVLKYEHVKSARGGANVKVKARNLITGNVFEKSFQATAKIDEASVSKSNAQYLYQDGTGFVFMNPNTYEQFSIPKNVIGDSKKFMSEGEKLTVMYFEGKPVTVELPKTMSFKVKYTEPGFKGNTVSNTFKDATLENDTVVKVPTFIKIGDMVKINTATGEYSSKA